MPEVVALTEEYQAELREAIKIAWELARENLAPEDMPEERKRQIDALATLNAFSTDYLEG